MSPTAEQIAEALDLMRTWSEAADKLRGMPTGPALVEMVREALKDGSVDRLHLGDVVVALVPVAAP